MSNWLSTQWFAVVKQEGGEVAPLPAGHLSAKGENLVAVRDLPAFLERTGLKWKL